MSMIKEATSGKLFDVGVVPVEVMQDAPAAPAPVP